MNVKAQGLINGALWIRESYGDQGLAEVLRGCSQAVRDRYISAIAIEWHPLEELCEFLTVADAVLGRGDGRIPEEIGVASARANMRSVIVRIATYVMRPDYLARRIGSMWTQFNDEGVMEIVVAEPNHITVRVAGLSECPRVFVQILTGWARVAVTLFGAEDAAVGVVEHRLRGPDAGAAWKLTWTKERAENEPPPAAVSPSQIPPSKGRIRMP